MTAPHFHTTSEVKAAIDKISHNSGLGDEGKPKGIAGGSAANLTTKTPGVTNTSKGDDWVHNRGVKGSSK